MKTWMNALPQWKISTMTAILVIGSIAALFVLAVTSFSFAVFVTDWIRYRF